MQRSPYEMLNTARIHKLTKTLAFATGMGAVLTDPEGRHIGPETNFCEFCKLMNRGSALQCYRSNRYALQIAVQTRKPFVFLCHAGLIDMITPLFLNDRLIGSLMAGQVNVDAPIELPRTGSHGMLQMSELLRSVALSESTRLRVEACADMLPLVADLIVRQVRADASRVTPPQSESIRPAEATLASYADRTGHAWLSHNYQLSRLLDMGQTEEARKQINDSLQLTRFLCVPQSGVVSLHILCDMLDQFIHLKEAHAGSKKLALELHLCEGSENLLLPTYCLLDIVADGLDQNHPTLKQEASLILRTSQSTDGFRLSLLDRGKAFLPVCFEPFLRSFQRSEDVLKEDLPVAFKKGVHDLLTMTSWSVRSELHCREKETELLFTFSNPA